jgi:hypothetical protein
VLVTPSFSFYPDGCFLGTIEPTYIFKNRRSIELLTDYWSIEYDDTLELVLAGASGAVTTFIFLLQWMLVAFYGCGDGSNFYFKGAWLY